jgi:hypothetical protein
MPIHQRSIDTHGFQIATTASDHENAGLGNIALDISLMMGAESLGAGLMGRPGMFGALTGGKPLMGLIPGVSPGAGGTGTARRQLFKGLTTKTVQTSPFSAAVVQNPAAMEALQKADRGFLGRRGTVRADGRYIPLGGKYSERTLVRTHAENPALRTKANSSIATRMGIGVGLKALSTAWIFNDMFSLFVGGVSSSIQGLESFAYERRLQPQSAGADLGEGFADTRASFTQRQTAMAAIHNSQMNTRAAMGNEATFMHV